jgi:hypothetical protein
MVAVARVLPLCALLLVLPSLMPSGLACAQGRPEFVYPADGQKIDSKSSFMFWVKPIANAQGYSWDIVQNGKVVAQRITGNEFGIHPGTAEHSRIVPGSIDIRVRALVKDKWTNPASMTISAVGQQPASASASAAKKQPELATQWLLLLLLLVPLLIVGLVRLSRFATAAHAKQAEAAYKSAMAWVLAALPKGLASAMKPPAEKLCLTILSQEGAFQNRRLPPQKIGEILKWLLYYLLLDRSQQLQIPNLLTREEGGEATFSIPLHSLHTDVANSIQGVYSTIIQHSSPDSAWAYDYPFYDYPFKRLARTLYDNWAKVNGFNPDRGEAGPQKGKGIQPEHLKDKISVEELIRRFLDGTPFVDFLRAKVDVSIPHRARFEHTHIVGGTGHGKTQLLQHLILHDLPHVAAGNRSVIVIDSQGDLINKILSLAVVGAMADRVIIIDPEETESPPALNLFDFGLERVDRYSAKQREKLDNGAVALFEYVFSAVMGAELTAKQGVIFGYLAHLLMVVPDATIDTLIDFLEKPEAVRPYLSELDDPISRRFFETQFFNKSFDETRQQILYRIFDVLKTRALARMFRNKRNKLDMFDAMNRGSLILIDTAKGFLKQEGCEIFGRFFLALICQATQERDFIAANRRQDTFVYIDEAHDYFDESMEHLLEEARKFRVGLVIAHQHLDQFDPKLRSTVHANTAVKLVGGISSQDARRFDEEMHCEPEFLLGMQKHHTHTEFACYIKNVEGLKRAIPLPVPFGRMDQQPEITAAGFAFLKAANRARFGATNERPPEKPKDDDSPLGDPELL